VGVGVGCELRLGTGRLRRGERSEDFNVRPQFVCGLLMPSRDELSVFQSWIGGTSIGVGIIVVQ